MAQCDLFGSTTEIADPVIGVTGGLGSFVAGYRNQCMNLVPTRIRRIWKVN